MYTEHGLALEDSPMTQPLPPRNARIVRTTNETAITVSVDLDGGGVRTIAGAGREGGLGTGRVALAARRRVA